jgi:hypothetical protein
MSLPDHEHYQPNCELNVPLSVSEDSLPFPGHHTTVEPIAVFDDYNRSNLSFGSPRSGKITHIGSDMDRAFHCTAVSESAGAASNIFPTAQSTSMPTFDAGFTSNTRGRHIESQNDIFSVMQQHCNGQSVLGIRFDSIDTSSESPWHACIQSNLTDWPQMQHDGINGSGQHGQWLTDRGGETAATQLQAASVAEQFPHPYDQAASLEGGDSSAHRLASIGNLLSCASSMPDSHAQSDYPGVPELGTTNRSGLVPRVQRQKRVTKARNQGPRKKPPRIFACGSW